MSSKPLFSAPESGLFKGRHSNFLVITVLGDGCASRRHLFRRKYGVPFSD